MVYLDNNATTIIAPEVLEEMNVFYSRAIGNPSSPHSWGREAKSQLNLSLKKIATFFHVKESEIVITSGATEGLNFLIGGFQKKGHIVSSRLEHMAVLEPLARKEREGWPVTYLQPEKGKGAIAPKQVEEAIRPDTSLIVLMGVNNETGIKTELDAIAKIALQKDIFLIVDGVALLGKEKFLLPQGVSAIAFSAHKFHGPLGIGFVIMRKNFPCAPLIIGGPQQWGRRGGTENLSAIVGLAKALDLICEPCTEKMKGLIHRLEEGILSHYPKAYIHGRDQERICNTTNICFPSIDGEELMIQLDLKGVAVGLGSACSSGGLEPSRVLLHMGVGIEHAKSSLRFSISRFTEQKEIETTLSILKELLS